MRQRRRSRWDQCTPPPRYRRGSTSATCRHHHRFDHQSYSHCRRRSSPRRRRYRRLRAHRCLPPSLGRERTRSRSGYPAVPARRRYRSPICQRFILSDMPKGPMSSPPVASDQGLHHGVRLLSMMSKTALMSTVTRRGVVNAGRRNKPARFWAAVTFRWGSRRGTAGWGVQGNSMCYGGGVRH